MMLPQDPVILLSYINTYMRDENCDFEEFCTRYEVNPEEVEEKLTPLGVAYDRELRRFY